MCSQNSASQRLCGEIRLSQNSAPARLRVKIPRLDLSAHTTFKCVLKTLRLSVSAVNSIFLKTPLLLVSALKFLASISQNYHSMNVTLLISRNVVVPCRSFSTADSRRNVIPSSRAARLISDVGRLFKINSRMRSDKSSSS